VSKFDSYAERLDAILKGTLAIRPRDYIALGPAEFAEAVEGDFDLAPGELDQLGAAAREQSAAIVRMGHKPGRGVGFHDPGHDDRLPLLQVCVLFAINDENDWSVCSHVRHTPAQPHFIQLAHRRVDCSRCLENLRADVEPSAGEDENRCDPCGARGVTNVRRAGGSIGALLGLWSHLPGLR
jgi:hypothetical protein